MYFVSIGIARTSGQYDKPEAERELLAHDLQRLPFGVENIDEAHLLVTLSRSPAWTIRKAESDDIWQEKGEIECSPMVARTRQLKIQEQEHNNINHLADIARINAQPQVVNRTYAGITVTFTRGTLEPTSYGYRRGEAPVSIRVGDISISPGSFITGSGAIQKKKWTDNVSRSRHSSTPWHEHLIPLAPHLKDIRTLARQLCNGTYKGASCIIQID